jgi:hypothetical protein
MFVDRRPALKARLDFESSRRADFETGLRFPPHAMRNVRCFASRWCFWGSFCNGVICIGHRIRKGHREFARLGRGEGPRGCRCRAWFSLLPGVGLGKWVWAHWRDTLPGRAFACKRASGKAPGLAPKAYLWNCTHRASCMSSVKGWLVARARGRTPGLNFVKKTTPSGHTPLRHSNRRSQTCCLAIL